MGRRTLTPIGARSRIWAELHRPASSKAVYANPPDPEMEVWKLLLRPGDLFVDVGANVGTYSVFAADCGASVIAAEPDASAAERLRENAALNGHPIEVHQVAVGASDGRIGFTVGLDTVNRIDVRAKRTVEMRCLDTMLGDGRPIRGIKVDVEGFELDVLRGAASLLQARRVDVWQLEWNSASVDAQGSDRDPLGGLLTDCGYELWRLEKGRVWTKLSDYRIGEDVFAFADSHVADRVGRAMHQS